VIIYRSAYTNCLANVIHPCRRVVGVHMGVWVEPTTHCSRYISCHVQSNYGNCMPLYYMVISIGVPQTTSESAPARLCIVMENTFIGYL